MPLDTSLPPIVSHCDTCNNENREDNNGPLQRCSVCKDRFYCSLSCQTKDWKEHKYSCSALPPEGLEYGKIQKDPKREVAIKGYVAALQYWSEEYERRKNNSLGGQIKFASGRHPICEYLIEDFKFPQELQSKRHPLGHSAYPFRTTLTLASRAFLLDLISRLSDRERTVLAERISRARIPARWTRLFGPKVVACPSSLSPGEYEAFGTLAPAFLFYDDKDDLSFVTEMKASDRKAWLMLSEAFKELWDAPRSIVYSD
ncbi:hypothetical protein AMATHDRAFT_2717 [Amanita thiersii Skay4041]|uniref:MYND-type domain-containing protein n=1 Tax=Amanita thiersii Skay4041 TaxID=703135 RepID=A0A2A9NNX0_9AGAR|nr:hypothetical protein AMATHDRAFT_2717 [Amanita thiersii Skay4041]